MVQKNSWDNVTFRQIELMKHTIGFSDGKVIGTKHRKYEPYRNYFAAGKKDKESLDPLCEIGLMGKRRESLYHVTGDGKKFLQAVTGVNFLGDMK